MALLVKRDLIATLVSIMASSLPLLAADLCDGMAYIPAGPFQMGDDLGVGGRDERPVHTPRLSAFYIDRCEVSNAAMRDTMQWAFDQGLIRVETNGVFNTKGRSRELLDTDDWNSELAFAEGRFSVIVGREQHPCIEVTWYGALAYANFRSLREQRSVCTDFSDWSFNFSHEGYRLPTEAEWEKAARGGHAGGHYSWGGQGKSFWTFVEGHHANYWGSGDAFENADGYILTTPVGYYNGSQKPPGGVMTNAFGLLDMTGNVEEWCLDLYERKWYSKKAADGVNPLAVSDETFRVVRGGSWITGQKEEWAKKSLKAQRYHLRIADRTQRDPGRGQHFRGFRCVRR